MESNVGSCCIGEIVVMNGMVSTGAGGAAMGAMRSTPRKARTAERARPDEVLWAGTEDFAIDISAVSS